MTSVMVTGANRGIGLGIVEQFLKDMYVKHVFATTRDIARSKELTAITDSRLHIIQMDVTNDESVKAALPKVEKIVGSAGLDILVNNSGVMDKYLISGDVDRQKALRTYDVNAVGALIVTQVFLPLIQKSRHPKVIMISSGVGSITNNLGSFAPFNVLVYAMSKSALNQLMKTLATDLKDHPIIFASFCPGSVLTDMSDGLGQQTVEQSTSALVSSIKKLSKANSGGFYKIDMEPIPF